MLTWPPIKGSLGFVDCNISVVPLRAQGVTTVPLDRARDRPDILKNANKKATYNNAYYILGSQNAQLN